MIEGLIAWLVVVVIVALIAGLILWALSQFPIAPPFGNIIRVCVIVIAVLIIVLKALPLLHVAV